MKSFVAISGQSIQDICLNTYQSLDFLVKLMLDNNHPGINAYPPSGKQFSYDDTLVVDANLSASNNTKGTIYSTAMQRNGSVLVTEPLSGSSAAPYQPYLIPQNTSSGTTPVYSKYYEQTLEAEYISGNDGLTSISLPDLIGSTVISVTKEITPLKKEYWVWNSSAGILTLQNGMTLDNQQTAYVLYSKLITQ